ncbi:MAG: MerR family transcriptional regulator [Lachnospiraceae bacterium]|nr:MerR family transcriptional regulator [Lachnospiraceae bacterium]
MEKVRYMISDAADMVRVETHVLRYWEEELDLTIPRNEMGHRYYTRENIQEFQKIKDLKDQGYQLKAIRMILHNGKLDMPEDESRLMATQARDLVNAVAAFDAGLPTEQNVQTTLTSQDVSLQQLSAEDRMCQFRELMSDIVGRAISQNNEELSQMIGKDVQELVLKEMNYLMREQDDMQEERYRKLDEAIRGKLRKKSFFSKEGNGKLEKKKAKRIEKKKVFLKA